MAFDELRNLAQRFIDLSVNVAINRLIEKRDFTELIIELNTDEQLFRQGVDSLGVKLGNYAASTIEGIPGKFKGKREKGLPFDHVTLFDTGEFYESFTVDIRNEDDDFFTINANPIKEDTNLFDEWGNDVVGLTEESKQILADKLRRELSREILKLI